MTDIISMIFSIISQKIIVIITTLFSFLFNEEQLEVLNKRAVNIFFIPLDNLDWVGVNRRFIMSGYESELRWKVRGGPLSIHQPQNLSI